MVQARTIRFTVFKWTIWFIRTIRVETSLPIQINWLTSLSACVFLFCFYPWPYVLNVSTFRRETANVFSIATHIFRNLLSKIRPLFEQILITCFKCSRASFSPSSCSEKMPWRRGCEIAIVWNYMNEMQIRSSLFQMENSWKFRNTHRKTRAL